ncbi:MAG TPA: KpsF/GutQ family sugar-phosphate isomerase [Acidobacteriaceae bacterium]|nr:KpsF/GutQ family sugar-phosphate isomerase [Acidobacteriaceae bacterium]
MATAAQTERTQASELVRAEARALLELAMRLDGPMAEPFARAVELFVEATGRGGRVIVLGMGKSGLIGRKIAATLCSTGTRAHFLHPAEARHGDLGMVAAGDVVLALSASGETEELLDLLPALERIGAKVVSFCGNASSTLAKASAVWLDVSVAESAASTFSETAATGGPHDLAPTASTTVMLALGDALALDISRRRGFAAEDFAELHPGGRLGRRLARVKTLMHSGEAMPQVSADTVMTQVIHEMSHKRLGMTTVVEAASGSGGAGPTLIGVISDGDLRRLLEHDGPNALAHTAGEIMHRTPVTISPEAFAGEALALMEERKITSLVVTSAQGEALGVVHLHDLWETSS